MRRFLVIRMQQSNEKLSMYTTRSCRALKSCPHSLPAIFLLSKNVKLSRVSSKTPNLANIFFQIVNFIGMKIFKQSIDSQHFKIHH